MSSVEPSKSTDPVAGVKPIDMKFEVVVIGVTDVNRARDFYKSLGISASTSIEATFMECK